MSTPAANISGGGGAPSTPPPSTGSPGGGGQPQSSGQPSSSLTPNQAFAQAAENATAHATGTGASTALPGQNMLEGQQQAQAAPQQPVTPPATPDFSQAFTDYGGKERVDRGMQIYDMIAGDQFDPKALGDSIAALSEERYGALSDDIFDNSPEYFINRALQNHPDALMKALKWDKGAYDQYKQWVDNGGALQNQPADPVKQELDQLKAQIAEREQAAIQQEREGKWNDFTQRLAEPINNLIKELGIQNNEEGMLWAEMLASGTQGLFSADKGGMEAMKAAKQFFDRGEYELGMQKYNQIRAAADIHGRKLAALVGRAMKALANEQQQTLQNGQQQINPLGAGNGQAAGSNGEPNFDTPFGYGPLSYESLKPQLDAELAKRRGTR